MHSFSARKQYIQNVLAVNARLLREMDSNHEEQMEREEGQSLQVARQRFKDTVKNLHHLTSTESCRGIFNSLRAVAKGGSLLEPGQGIPEADLQASWIQAEGPGTPSGSSRDGADWQVGMEFNSVETPFISAVHDREVAMRQSIRASEPYVSPHQRDVDAKHLAAKANISDRPFVTSVHNRDLFQDTLV